MGRSFTDILALAPGVTDTDGDGNPNVRGARDTGLQLRLDGSNVTNPLTGKISQQGVNLESIEQVDVITAAAPAEYSRADGGFANVITKSGGNDLDGSLKVFYRSSFLDGDGAGTQPGAFQSFSDTDAYLTIGGPIVRDHLWYFATMERLDEEIPVVLPSGDFGLRTLDGWRGFGKVTWQVNTSNRLALQMNYDPVESTGNNIGPGIDPETDYRLRTGGTLPQFTWTAVLTPTLLLQYTLSRLEGHADIDPTSGNFGPIPIETRQTVNGEVIPLPCDTLNCQGETRFRTFVFPTPGPRGASSATAAESGPYNYSSYQDLTRTTVRSDLSYTVEQMAGQHSFKAGFEYALESYSESGITNPILTDRTCSFGDRGCNLGGASGPPPASNLGGSIYLEVFDPQDREMSADGYNAGAYFQDAWKPWPNLTINAGLRYDHEEIDSSGYTDFDPITEAREVARNYDLLCDAAGLTCVTGLTPANLPSIIVPPPGHPALRFDLNGDGIVETAGAEGDLIQAPFTSPAERSPDQFLITNNNLAPRFSLAWDPWSNGKTKLFGSWGKYYDRLFLSSVATEQQPESLTAQWTLAFFGTQGYPGTYSLPLQNHSIAQTGRELRTPYTIERTFGIERELAPEWAVTLSYISRQGHDLLQDKDLNHITCKQFDTTFHTDPYEVCGDGGALELDRFGKYAVASSPFYPGNVGVSIPNGAIDLYNLNHNYNQILRVGNYNGSKYTAIEMVLRKRLHRNWQMLFSYTWSKARGEAESFDTILGNDPAVSEAVGGYLDFDQRHVIKWQGVTHLPHGLLLGGSLQWASGLPYSLIYNVEDRDNLGNLSPQRVFTVTGVKNDQRNNSQVTLNGRIEKRLSLGSTLLSAFVEGENLLDGNELTLQVVDRDSRGTVQGTRRYGRRWEMGVSVFF